MATHRLKIDSGAMQDVLEVRVPAAAWLPWDLANVPVVRWTVLGGTAEDTSRLAATFSRVAEGTRFRFLPSGHRRADLTVLIAGPGPLYVTYGTVRHAVNRRGLPYGYGDAVISLPSRWTIDGAAHELGHALGLIHVSGGPSAPTYTSAEWARLDAYGESIGWSPLIVQVEYGKQPGSRDNGFDVESLWNIDPYAHPALGGPEPHLSPLDRSSLVLLFGPSGTAWASRRPSAGFLREASHFVHPSSQDRS